MATATLNARIDRDLKERFDEVAANIGITPSAAINVFARQFVSHRGFPFEVVEPKPAYEPFETEEEAADFTTAGLRRAANEAW